MSVNLTSRVTILQLQTLLSYSMTWSGSTPVGTVSVEASNDYSQNADGTVNNAGTWNVLTLNYGGSAVTTVPVTGNTGNGFIDVGLTGAYAVRLIYTAGSGTGALNAIVTCKVS